MEDEIDARIARERLAEIEAGLADTISFEDALTDAGLK